ncbi:MAG: hypothetical protein ACYTF9_05160 [Planctomycetota bacterium]|jgi:hypothetical protein
MPVRDDETHQRSSTLQRAAFWLALLTAVATPCVLEWFFSIPESDVSALYHPGLSILAWLLLALSVWRRDRWSGLTTLTIVLWAFGLMFSFSGHALGWTRDGTLDPYRLHTRLPMAMLFTLIFTVIPVALPALALGGLASFRRSVPYRRAARGLCTECCHRMLMDQDTCPECGAQRWHAPPPEPPITGRVLTAVGLGCLIPALVATVILEAEEVVFARDAEAAAVAGENEFERQSLFDGRMWWRRDGATTPADFGGGFGSHRD